MAKLKNKISYIIALLLPMMSSIQAFAQDEPKGSGSDEEALKEAKGSLSAGAIAAAVAAAAAIAAATSDDGNSAPAPTPDRKSVV